MTTKKGGAIASSSSSKQIASFLAKYAPATAAAARKARAAMRKRVPGGVEFVYDNYNALVFGYGPTDRPSDAVLSLAIMPRWVTLCFLKGAKLPDPHKLLRGSGTTVRNVQLVPPKRLGDREIQRFIELAIAGAHPEFPGGKARPRTIVKSISAKQRPRRPRRDIS
jgi:hypothetical protein